MLSKKSLVRLPQHGRGREKICAPRERLGRCSVEQFLRTHLHPPYASRAPVRYLRRVRNRSTDALLNWIWPVWSPAFRRPPKGGTPHLSRPLGEVTHHRAVHPFRGDRHGAL